MKKEQVRQMFDAIALKYDFLNRFLSLGIDDYWRKKALRSLVNEKNGLMEDAVILDVATGTGDFALQALSLRPKKIIGIDISEGMLRGGKEKIKQKKLDSLVNLQWGDSENIQFPDATFDAVIVAFGVRNFENLQKGLQEIGRVLKPKQKVIILELTVPTQPILKLLYQFYSFYILPFLGRFFSKNKEAYEYLPSSIRAFPQGEKFLAEMRKAGFCQVSFEPLTGGITTLYVGEK
jgi:demethylmenaquinone methyltransferase/2-methoxy-6-polyprenyl-1,4-benzoquinol methylase